MAPSRVLRFKQFKALHSFNISLNFSSRMSLGPEMDGYSIRNRSPNSPHILMTKIRHRVYLLYDIIVGGTKVYVMVAYQLYE